MNILVTLKLTEDQKNQFENVAPNQLTYIERKNVKKEDVENVDVILGSVDPSLLQYAKKLQWLQLEMAGANRFVNVPGEFILTNASGAYNIALAEYMLACTLVGMKKLPNFYHQQQERIWQPLGMLDTVFNSKVLCIGMGDIGTRYAKIMKFLGANVDGVRRTLKDKPDVFDNQYQMKDLADIIGNYDVIASSLPETKDTIKFLNKELLSKTKKGSILINVGRGSAIDELALIDLCNAEHFKDVFLDVVSMEPLPKNNPLWTTKNVHITPHIAGGNNTQITIDQVNNIILTNLKHYLNQERLEHIVDKKAGY